MAAIKKFNVENCDIRTQLIFEEWATVPCLKILTLLLARKGKSVFSAKGIGEMLEIPKSTVIHSLKLLREHEYIIREGGHYYLNLGFRIDQPIGQSTNPLVEVDQPIGRESTNPLVTNNDKEIMIKNKPAAAGPPPDNLKVPPKHLSQKSEPLFEKAPGVWLTRTEQKKLLEKIGDVDEVKFLILELSSYSRNKPSAYKQNKDHYETLLNWRRMKHGDGKVFYKDPKNGPNYYYRRVVEGAKVERAVA